MPNKREVDLASPETPKLKESSFSGADSEADLPGMPPQRSEYDKEAETGFQDTDATLIAGIDDATIDSATLTDSMIGKRIAGKFEIISVLGSGGMSVVYRAKHLMLDREVAVKLIHPGQMQEKVMQRFRQEAKAATSLNHANIATVREFGYDEINGAYLAMDFVNGLSLSDAIKESGTLSAERVKNLFLQICDGLKHAHEAGVVHRDIKPANIILTSDANGKEIAKIVDFGIAKLVDEENQSNLTQTGEVFGTPNYMSPEQCLGKKADARSDIYSLGCVLFECLTGKVPFQADSAIHILMKHVNEPIDLSKIRQHKVFANCIEGCLEKKPDDRWQSISDLKESILNPDSARKGIAGKRRKKVSTKQLIGITATAVLLSFVAAILVTMSGLSPTMKASFFPSDWNRLAARSDQQKSLGPNNYDSARSLLVKAIAAAQKGGAGDADFENLYRKMAQLCTASRDNDGAIKYFNLALKLNEKHAEDFNRGSMHDWVSTAYSERGEYLEAVEHAQKAVDVKKRTIGPEHEYTLFALLHLGQAQRLRKDFSSAEITDREALRIAQKIYPAKDNIELANAYYQLANILADQHKDAEAAENYKKSIPISSAVLGNDHPTTRKNRDFIVSFLRRIGQKTEAAHIASEYSK